jgi:TolB-like protein
VAFEWSSLEPWFRRGDAICVMLLPLRASGASADFIEEIYDRLLLSVSETRQIQLIAPTTARFYAGRSGDIRTFASETGADFVVEGSVWVRGEVVGTTLWPVDGQTGRSLPPCNLIGSNVDELSARAAECLVLRLTGGNVTSSATPA